MIEEISFIQHNTHRSKEAHLATLQQAAENKIDILLIQEPYTFQPQNQPYISVSHSAFHTLFPASELYIRPRVFIYINKTTKVSVNSRPDIVYDPDIQVIEVITKEETFLVINLYNEKEQ